MEEDDILKIKEFVEEFLGKMTITVFSIEVNTSFVQDQKNDQKDFVDMDISVQEPQILIGQNGQTLFELTRLLRIMLNKKLQKASPVDRARPRDFYLNLDIDGYKKKKIEYLKDLATTLADQVAKTKEEKVLPPMPSYERRILHAELSQRQDVITQSQGEGVDRCVVIKPR